jgi:hypothetical protein
MAKGTVLRLSVWSLFFCSLLAHSQTVATFEGIDASQVARPIPDVDPNGAVGTKQYMEWTNSYYQAFDKATFAPVWAKPLAGATPWINNSVANCTNVAGDGLIIFDRLASRWVIAAHNSGSSSYYYCVAVSNTDDLTSPTLAWFTYAFPLNTILGSNSQGTTYFPDWPKLATWPDAYYLGIDLEDVNNNFQEAGVVACALDRANMLIGATANPPQCFHTPSTPGPLFLGHGLEPADVEGTTPPAAGSPEYFASIQNPLNDGVTTTSDTFNLWQFHVDWTTPANSTFTQSTVPVTAFTPGCYSATSPGNTVCVPEPSTSTTLQSIDSVGDRFMFRFAYRNFGGYQSYLISHTVQVGAGNLSQTGIRWYELRGSGTPALFQSGTISPDTSLYRFMPSVAQDQSGNAAVGYSVSSTASSPGMKASWWSLTAPTAPTEIALFSGAGDEENSYHWGDYSSMTVDPVGGCAFWYVNQYFSQNQTGAPIWKTRISNFSLPTCGGVTLAPSSLTFGVQAIGTTSPRQNLILSNGASTTLTIHAIFGAGADPGDFTQSNDCGTNLSPGGACTIRIAFAPTTTGTRTATLNVSDSDAGSPQVATLTGTGTTAPTLSFSTSSVNFGNQTTGTTSAVSSITVTNTGAATVTFSGIAVTGTNATNFTESDNCLPNLAVGNTCTINVTFSPSATGSFSASVTVTDNAAGSPQSISLAGTGIAPVTLSATALNFGAVLLGTSSTAKPVTVTNQMSVALTGITVAVTGNAAYSEVNTCGTSVAAGGKCTVTVTFAPTTTGTQTGTVTITDSASNSPQTISLTGIGQVPVTVSPLNLAFGAVKVGTTSASKIVAVTNNQKVSLTITSVALSGLNAGDYSQTATTCGSTLAARSKCTVTLTFTPQALGARTATLTFTDSANTSPQKVKLSGTGN